MPNFDHSTIQCADDFHSIGTVLLSCISLCVRVVQGACGDQWWNGEEALHTEVQISILWTERILIKATLLNLLVLYMSAIKFPAVVL